MATVVVRWRRSTWVLGKSSCFFSASSMGRGLLVVLASLMLSNAFDELFGVPGNALLDNINQKSFWEARFSTHIPSLKMLRRQIRHLNNGKTLAVTIVYQATRPVQTRWFRKDNTTLRLFSSEVPLKLPVEGDPNYELSYMKSGEVTAATLTIRRIQEFATYDLETILTTKDGAVQYQMSTLIRPRPEPIKPEFIDSPEWLLVAPTHMEYIKGGSFGIHCAAFVARENTTHTNELILSRATIADDGAFRIEPLLRIHKDTQDVVEGRHDNGMFIGKRIRTSVGHVVYYIRLSRRNATSAFAGVYQCSMERKEDRLLALSTVHMTGTAPVLLPIPLVELVSCEDNYDKLNGVLQLTEGVATCFRCRAVASPTTKVTVYQGTQELFERPGIGITKYVNVMDTGVVEATYTFHNPSASAHNGNYYCHASKANPVRFSVRVSKRRPGRY